MLSQPHRNPCLFSIYFFFQFSQKKGTKLNMSQVNLLLFVTFKQWYIAPGQCKLPISEDFQSRCKWILENVKHSKFSKNSWIYKCIHLKSRISIFSIITTTPIWATCSRTDIPCKICRWFPQHLFSLTPLNPLIYNAFVLEMVLFIYSWVASRILHKKIDGGCPKICLNSLVFW